MDAWIKIPQVKRKEDEVRKKKPGMNLNRDTQMLISNSSMLKSRSMESMM